MTSHFLIKYIRPKSRINLIILLLISFFLLSILLFLYFYIFKNIILTKNENIKNEKVININDEVKILVKKNDKNNIQLNNGEYKKETETINNVEYYKYIYTIQKNDTLWKISLKFLNDSKAWPEIQKYNKNIKDPHWIKENDQIIIYIPKK